MMLLLLDKFFIGFFLCLFFIKKKISSLFETWTVHIKTEPIADIKVSQKFWFFALTVMLLRFYWGLCKCNEIYVMYF